ncbi:MAG: hypothetical protein V4635_08860 [Bacteroidota bacterium]
MDILDDEILNLWRLLNKHDVFYIMVGGFATTFHGFNRATADLDLWIRDDQENRKKLRSVLKEMDLGDFESIETTQFTPGYTSIMLNSGFELDIMTSLKGFDQARFGECYQLSVCATVEDTQVRFMHINQLIEAKKSSGRPKDLIDVEELEKIKNLKS